MLLKASLVLILLLMVIMLLMDIPTCNLVRETLLFNSFLLVLVDLLISIYLYQLYIINGLRITLPVKMYLVLCSMWSPTWSSWKCCKQVYICQIVSSYFFPEYGESRSYCRSTITESSQKSWSWKYQNSFSDLFLVPNVCIPLVVWKHKKWMKFSHESPHLSHTE